MRPTALSAMLVALAVPFVTGFNAGIQAGQNLVKNIGAAGGRFAMQELRADTHGFISLSGPMMIVGLVIGGLVGIIVLAAVAPEFFTGLATLVGVFEDPNTTTGNPVADSLLPIFALVIAFGGLAAIVGLAIAWIRRVRD